MERRKYDIGTRVLVERAPSEFNGEIVFSPGVITEHMKDGSYKTKLDTGVETYDFDNRIMLDPRSINLANFL